MLPFGIGIPKKETARVVRLLDPSGELCRANWVGMAGLMDVRLRWWQLKDFWNFHPDLWGNDPI